MESKIKHSLVNIVLDLYVDKELLPGPVKRYLIGRRYNEEVRIWEERYLAAAEAEDYEYIHSHKISNRNEVAETLAKEYEISSGTIFKYGAFARTLEQIYEKNEVIAKGILSGETHLSHKDMLSIAKHL